MTIDDKIRDEKLPCIINRETAKISALSSGKSHKYRCITSEKVWRSNRSQMIEQAKFTHSTLRKALKKQTKK